MSGAAQSRTSVHEPTVVSQPSELENRATRIFRASPERVFRFFTDPATMPYVWSTDPKNVTIEQMEVRPGGRYSLRVTGPDGVTLRFFGEFREVVPAKRVVNTFEVSNQPGVVAVETDIFEPVGSSTRVTVTWKYDRREARDQMAGPELAAALTALWNHVADLLAQAGA